MDRSISTRGSVPMTRRKIKDVADPVTIDTLAADGLTVETLADHPPRFASEAFDLDFVRGHRVEQEVQRELMSVPDCRFASLVVRRLDNGGVCLQGVLEADDDIPDVCAIAQRVSGVQKVLNHLLVTPRRELPLKG